MMSNHVDESAGDHGIAVVRTVARCIALPVVVLLLAGLVAVGRDPRMADSRAAAALTTLPLHDLATPGQVSTPLGVLTAGLVLLATAPMLTVLLVTLAHGRARRWREAAIAAGVLAVLAMSVVFKGH